MIEQIAIDNEAYTEEKMKAVYKTQKKELDALNTVIGTLFIKYAVDGLLKMNSQDKSNAGIKETLKNIGKTLGEAEVKTVTGILGKAYADTYYKNAFIMDSGLKIDLKFNILKKEFIDAAVKAKYKGDLFSDRIWTNKADMIDQLQSNLTEAMQGKITIDKVARNIKNTFNTTAYESQRLVRTENARIQSQAIDDIGRSAGVTQQMYSATLDMLTNPIDASFDGNLYDINDDSKPDIPQHPNCRCVYINVPYDGWAPTGRKDNETKDIIDYKNYDTWLKYKGISNSKSSDTNSGNSDIIKLPDIQIGRSIGAKAKNYNILMPNGEYVNLVEGTKITNSTVIAGKGKDRKIDELDGIVADYGGNPYEWQKAKGFGYLDVDGEELKAELHWYQESSVGKVKMKVKPQKDGEIFIYED